LSTTSAGGESFWVKDMGCAKGDKPLIIRG